MYHKKGTFFYYYVKKKYEGESLLKSAKKRTGAFNVNEFNVSTKIAGF